MAYRAIIFLEVIMEKLLLVLICILGIVMMVKGLIARFKYRLKATRCSLQAPGKIFICTFKLPYTSTYFQMKYFKNNKRVTVDYDPNSPDTFIIEEELFTIRFTNFLIFSGFVLVCCAALFII